MLRYALRRLLIAIPTLLGITIIVFSIASLAPGDPASLKTDVQDPRVREKEFERIRDLQVSAVENELRSNNDEEFGKETLEWMLYKGHPYGHPVDGTVEGIELLDAPAFSVQYHPESSPGPHDARALFGRFAAMMERRG